MKPDTERSDQVVARVVAWHNRHPLATRITADQVHSVGVVSLPFAVQGAQVQAVPPVPPAPTDTADPPTEAPTDAPADASIDAPPAAEAPTILDRALAGEAGTDLPAQAEPATRSAPPGGRVQWQVSSLPARRPAWHPLAWWQRLRGRDPYRALFTEDFIAPLRPGRVARWAADHGRPDWPLEPAASQRMVMLDAALRRDGDSTPELDLHLITAAIGVGDGRLRLLLAPGAGGAVLGARHWSRQRLAVALPVLAGLLVSAGVLRQALLPSAAAPTPAMASVAPPASVPFAASAAVAAASQAAEFVPEPAAEPVAVAASAADAVPAAAPVDSVEPRRGRVELPPLVPPLADAQRHALRESGRALRQEPVEAVKAWALVTPLLRDRRQSERVAAQLQAVALLQPVPMRAELLPSAQGWHAVFWPFTSERDAQKIRLALADKGLKTELMEF